jgi:hypothetical protein
MLHTGRREGADVPGDGLKPNSEPVTAFVDVHVIPMNRAGVLDHQTVIVRGTRIEQMGPATQVRAPAGAVTIDGRGKYLIPGLTEMHGHLPNPNAGPELTENVLFLYVANGVTTVRGMQGLLPHLELKSRAARGDLLSPRLWVSGPPLPGLAPTLEAGRRMVEQHAAGSTSKIHEGLSRETTTRSSRPPNGWVRFAGHAWMRSVCTMR